MLCYLQSYTLTYLQESYWYNLTEEYIIVIYTMIITNIIVAIADIFNKVPSKYESPLNDSIITQDKSTIRES